MIILGVDPGETTGYVVVDYDVDNRRISLIAHGEWSGMEELLSLWHEGLFNDVEVIALEQYIIYPNRAMNHIGDSLYTAQEIGRLKWIAFRFGIDVEEQAASMAKQRWPASRLHKRVDEIASLMRTPHELDSLRHALTYIERNLRE